MKRILFALAGIASLILAAGASFSLR